MNLFGVLVVLAAGFGVFGCAGGGASEGPKHADPAETARARDMVPQATQLLAQHRPAEARAVIDRALPLLTPGALEEDELLYQLQVTLGQSFRDERQHERALPPFGAAIATASRHEPEMAVQVVDASMSMADVLTTLDRYPEASRALERALQVATRQPRAADLTSRVAVALTKAKYGAPWKATAGTDSGVAPARSERKPPVAQVVTPPEVVVVMPKPTGAAAAAFPDPSPSDGAPTGADSAARVIASMRSDFRGCYQAALATAPELQGNLDLTLHIGADGRVTSVDANAPGVPKSAVDCFIQRASAARFEPPANGRAVIAVPVKLVWQE